jgi:hypothetical protein
MGWKRTAAIWLAKVLGKALAEQFLGEKTEKKP